MGSGGWGRTRTGLLLAGVVLAGVSPRLQGVDDRDCDCRRQEPEERGGREHSGTNTPTFHTNPRTQVRPTNSSQKPKSEDPDDES
jgi:hypothetical protein